MPTNYRQGCGNVIENEIGKKKLVLFKQEKNLEGSRSFSTVRGGVLLSHLTWRQLSVGKLRAGWLYREGIQIATIASCFTRTIEGNLENGAKLWEAAGEPTRSELNSQVPVR